MTENVTTLDFPYELFMPTSGPFGLKYFDETFISRVGAARPTSSGPGFALWSADLEMAPLTDHEANHWQARMARFIDQNVAFRISDPFRELPAGSGAGFATKNTEVLFVGSGSIKRSITNTVRWIGGSTICQVSENAERYADTIVLEGLPASTRQVFKIGDGLEIGSNLYMVTSDADTDANGKTRVQITWKLWKPALSGDTVKTRNPAGRFVFADRDSLDIIKNPAYAAGHRLVAVEFPYT